MIYAGGAIGSGIRLASLKKEMSDLDVEKERQELQLTRLRNTGKVMNRKIVTILHLPEETVIIPDSTVLASEIPVLCEQYWHDKANSGNISLRQSDISVRIKEECILATEHVLEESFIGSALYSRGLAYFITDNAARYGAALDSVAVSADPAGYASAAGQFAAGMEKRQR